MKYFLLLSTLIFADSAISQTTPARDLLSELGDRLPVVLGEWSLENGSLKVAPSPAARCRIAENMPDKYDLTVEFTRLEGNGTVIAILPVGNVSPALEIAAWNGEAHGLSRVDGHSSKDPGNPTSVFPGRFENGEKQVLEVSVEKGESTSTIAAKLNGKPLFAWTGKNSSLEQNVVMNLPESRTLGLAAHESSVIFHRVLMRTESPPIPQPTTTPTPANEDTIDLSALGDERSPGWEPFNGGKFSNSSSGIKADPSAGAGDRGALLDGIEFENGAIEVELKGANHPGASFLGIVFHGVDGENYEAVYFRPFNFGHSDPVRRSHAVQYISHPSWPWDRLRKERGGEFEAEVSPEPKPDDRFRARIEVAGRRVRVFMNDSEKPCLDVERIGSVEKGKVGLWYNGTATFYSFGIAPL